MGEFSLRKPYFKIPRPSSRLMIRLRGIFHEQVLKRLARPYYKYCKIFNIPLPLIYNHRVIILPFNTVLKQNPRVNEGEALAMTLAHSLGLPASRMISYGDDGSGQGASIWMSRIEGELLDEEWPYLTDDERATIVNELDQCLVRLRKFPNPNGEKISSLAGARIPSFRVAKGFIFPVNNKREFLMNVQNNRNLPTVSNILDIHHDIVLTHGDLQRHNILVKSGHLSGIIDWECAGWLPEYWDYTTMLSNFHFDKPKNFWNALIEGTPGYKYAVELEADMDIICTTQNGFRYF